MSRRFEVSIEIMPKHGISDPQGQTIEKALPTIGLPGFEDVHVGKMITLFVRAEDEAAAGILVEQACKKFLTNPIIEDHVARIAATEDHE